MKSSLVHLIALFFVLLLFLAGAYFWYEFIVQESVAVAALQQDIAANTERVEQAKKIEATLAVLSAAGSVEGHFVSEANIVSFLEELERTGAEIGTTVRVLSVGAAGAKGAAGLPFSLSIEGSFDAVMRTIGAIEYSPYALSVSTASLTHRGGEARASWGASVSLVVSTML